jgi:hypothetical protein
MPEKISKILIPLSIIIAGLIIAGAFIYINSEKKSEGALSAQEAAEKAIDFINENFPAVNNSASLVEITEEGDIYKIHFKISLETGEYEYDSYVTKDGKYLFPEGYDMEENLEEESSEETGEIPVQEKPDVELFVMSFCPYGNQAENTMLPVYNLLKDKVNWSIYYIVSVNDTTVNSLHGQPEVDQNEREACVLEESGLDKWWQFTTYVNNNCGGDGSCWQDAAESAGLNTEAIEGCVSSKGFSLMQENATVTDEFGVTGSPTMFVNGTKTSAVYQYGSPQAYLDAICEGFTSAPQECSQQLSDGGSSSTPGGSCE